MSPKKMGRPKIENPKARQVAVRMDAETSEKLDYSVRALGKTVAEVLRMGIEKIYEGLTQK